MDETMAVPREADGHDIVVIGASTGGIHALFELVANLPPDLGAAVFIVIHSHPDSASQLPELLSRRGPIPATHALHGESILRTHIYVAPPDTHVLVRPGRLEVVRGAKENGHRPAVDVLFRTAAASYGPRVVGIVLTGHLDCGTAGLLSIKTRGGISVAQDPREAVAPSMPRSAIEHAAVDHVATLREIPGLLAELVKQPAGTWPAPLPPAIARIEGGELGTAAEIVCPACQGKLTVGQVNDFNVFRCHVGHSFSLSSLAAEQAEHVERALWAAVRALEEGASLSRRLHRTAAGTDLRKRFEEKERSQMNDADVVRRLLTRTDLLSETDGAALLGDDKKEGTPTSPSSWPR
jgi:two-component system chemotaxis response regulator CheB